MQLLKTPLIFALLIAGSLTGCRTETITEQTKTPNAYTQESPAEHDARMKWFREARFGMFIHWGLYSQAAGEWNGQPTSGAGEWMMNDLQIHPSDYAKLVPQFNPVKFNARDWVRVAKNAGMKYICITTKHHDGFALYPTALTDWCISATPFQRDPLKELAQACKDEGITLCFYHSIMDWHHPAYAPRKSWFDGSTNAPDFEKYVAFLKGELKELLTNYGTIGMLWFDGNWESSWNYDRGADLYSYVRSLQPNLIVNNRVGKDRAGVSGTMGGQERVGDYGTPEQMIPANGFGPGVDWEACMTMNHTWGFKASDHDWKSSKTLVRNLIDCASKGGNYLLNVGPTGEGVIPEASIERLREVGDWMKVNGETIYATAAGPFKRQLTWGRCTTKSDGKNTTLYLHVFEWPANGKLLLPGLKNRVRSAALLTQPQSRLRTSQSAEGVTISLPSSAPDAISSTVVLQIKGAPEVVPSLIAQQPDGSIALSASDADLHGHTLQLESRNSLNNIGYWTNPQDWAGWDFNVTEPGTFEVTASIAAQGSGAFEIGIGKKTLQGKAPVTGEYQKFETVKLGTIEIPRRGKTTLSVRPVVDGWQPLNLQLIELKPISRK